MNWNFKIVIIATSIIHVTTLGNNGFVADKFLSFKVGAEESHDKIKEEVKEKKSDLSENTILSNIEVILEDFRQSLSAFIKDWSKIANVENPELISDALEIFLTEIKRFGDEQIEVLKRLSFEDVALKYRVFRFNVKRILDDVKKTFKKLLLIPQKDLEDFSKRAGSLAGEIVGNVISHYSEIAKAMQ